MKSSGKVTEKKKGLPKNVQIAGFGMLSALFMMRALSNFFPSLREPFLVISSIIFVSFVIYLVGSLVKK
jgi:hypothetical protein